MAMESTSTNAMLFGSSSSLMLFYLMPLLIGFIISLGVYFPVVYTEIKKPVMKYGLLGLPVVGCVLLILSLFVQTNAVDEAQLAKQRKTKYSLLGVGLFCLLPLIIFVVAGTFYIAGTIIR